MVKSFDKYTIHHIFDYYIFGEDLSTLNIKIL